MSEHKITLEWKRESEQFTYESYNRDHVVIFDGGARVDDEEYDQRSDFDGELQELRLRCRRSFRLVGCFVGHSSHPNLSASRCAYP